MAYTVIPDLHEGSELAQGYASITGERATRSCIVETSDTAGTRLGVIGAVYADGAFGAYHNEITDLPLQFIVASRLGPKRWRATAVYSWAGQSGWGGTAFNTLAEYRVGYEGTQCYTVGAIGSDGLPPPTASGGTLKDGMGLTNLAVRPQPYVFMRPVIRVGVPKQLGTNPMTATIAGLMGKLNNASCVIGGAGGGSGITYGAGTLRFDGGEFIARTNTGLPFQGTWLFTSCPAFNEQKLDKVSGAWKVTNEASLLATANFNTPFGI